MPGISPMVSLRIPEDHLMELDRLVGFDGMKQIRCYSRGCKENACFPNDWKGRKDIKLTLVQT